jgi:Icc-related predicted phosphoesterase
MKIVAVSDMHGNLAGLNMSGFDVCIIAGDFSYQSGFGKWPMKHQRDWIHDEFNQWVKNFPETIFIVVAGNHDLCLDPSKTFRYSEFNWNIEWPKNCRYLCDSSTVVNGLTFYGTPYVPIINYCWAFEANYEKLKEKFANIPKNIDILITHTPPRIPEYLGDMSLEYGLNSEKFGSSELANAIFDKNPKYVFCGHIHSGSHEAFYFNNTTIYNVSRVNESYNIQYEPTIITIDN